MAMRDIQGSNDTEAKMNLPEAQYWLVAAMLAQVLLTFLLILALPFPRFSAAFARRVTFQEDGRPVFPKRTTQLGDCVNNQFQMPMLFFVAALLGMQLDVVTMPMAMLAGLFVALRWVHAAIFVTSNFIPARFLVFVGSALALLAIWVMVALRLLG
jgi:hypothetical protein